MEFKKSITKEEMEELPSFVYPGEIVVNKRYKREKIIEKIKVI